MRSASWIRRAGLSGVALTLGLWALNVPFYAGGGWAHGRWRMEHGRLRVERSSVDGNPESFYVDRNTEGLRLAPKWRFNSASDWSVNVPLWVPLILFAAFGTGTELGSPTLALSIARRRQHRGRSRNRREDEPPSAGAPRAVAPRTSRRRSDHDGGNPLRRGRSCQSPVPLPADVVARGTRKA